MLFFRFIAALLIAGSALGVTSLLWPRFSTDPRPTALEYVRDFVVTTPLGNQAARILGVSDDRNITPTDMGTVVSSVAGSVVSSVENKAEQYIAQRMTEQIIMRINKLPEEQQQYVKELLCTPE